MLISDINLIILIEILIERLLTILLELFGLFGSVLIFISMLYKSNTRKGNITMRIWNLLGSIVFVIYGICLPAYSTIVLNVFMIILHIYHIVVLLKEGDNNANKC